MKKLKLNKSHKLLLMSVVMAVSLFGGTTITPLSTALAVTCSGFGCDHVSPVTSLCNDSSTVTKRSALIYWHGDITSPIGKVELRYSPLCGTVWSRNTVTDPTFDPYYSTVTVWRKLVIPSGTYYAYDEKIDYISAGAQNWSHMLYLPPSSSDGYSAAACGRLDTLANGSGTDGSACTVYWTGFGS